MTNHETTNQPHIDDVYVERSWLYNHIGRISGIVLGLITFMLVAFLAIIGSQQAVGLLVVFLFGVVVIAIGTRLRGGGR